MKKMLLGLALLTTLTTVSFAGSTHNEKKSKTKAKSGCCTQSGHACCAKKAKA